MRVQLIRWLQVTFLVLCTAAGVAQDTTYQKQELVPSDIRLLLSYYTQDGEHSAVTGGIGTEKLKVYSVKYDYKRAVGKFSKLLLDLGIDIISSASTDQIDFNMSSASRKDGHETVALGYSRTHRKRPVEYGAKLKGSLESDYLSKGFEVWGNIQAPNLATYGANVQIYLADLRWGWLNKPYFKPRNLIYPVELRDTAWFDSAHRTSYNVSLSYQREFTQSLSLGIYPTIVLQKGLLSTPFHRVYFSDLRRPRVENLPNTKFTGALGFQLNTVLGRSAILRSFYQYYSDDYGMRSHTLRLAVPYQVNGGIVISPNLRLYRQRSSRYFAAFEQHLSSSEFYSSDYDLSGFWSTNIGVTVTLNRAQRPDSTGQWYMPGVSFRYSYYSRSDDLRAHIFSTLFRWDRVDSFDKLVRPRP